LFPNYQTSIFFIDAFGKKAQFFPLIADGIMRDQYNLNGRALPKNVAAGDSFSTLGPYTVGSWANYDTIA
jgi:hypothetical protein